MPLILSKDRPWSYADTAALWELAKNKMTLEEIASRLSRSEESVSKKAQELDITLASSK